MAAQYIGNNDFRGYLNYLSKNGDAQATTALQAGVGNDGGFNSNYLESYYDSPLNGNRNAEKNALKAYAQNQYAAWNGQYLGAETSRASTYDPNTEIARTQIDQGINQNQDALNRIDGQLNTALGNIGSQYNDAYNRLTASQAAATRDYNTNVTNQEKDYLNAREGIQTNAAARLANARRILGINGAGGGSADRFAVPNVVQQNAANDNAGVQQTNARNLASLATAKEDNDRKFKNSFDDLSSQRESSERNTRSQFEQQRASILDSIAQLTGQNSILNGGNYQSALAAAAPYRNRVAGILNTIDSLAANPAVLRENAPTLTTASLADYINPRTNLPAQTGRVAQDTSLSPAIAALLGYDQEQRQLI